jgi:hypothetical protein
MTTEATALLTKKQWQAGLKVAAEPISALAV